jgi:spore photoproduct lyase
LIKRIRKSNFVRLFTKTPPGVVCPHFYELILSNGCPFNCLYCYLKLTFRGNKSPVLFTNSWQEVEKELEKVSSGVFSTGELADSLAIEPPLLKPAIEYFRLQKHKYLLLTTKSNNINILSQMEPTSQLFISFSINSMEAWEKYESLTPNPFERIDAAIKLKKLGWQIRIRLDPIIWNFGINNYKKIIDKILELSPNKLTIGTLRQYPGLYRFEKEAPKIGLKKSFDGRMRYPLETRAEIYSIMSKWLGFEPGLCKETTDLWKILGWKNSGCNCTIGL